YTWTYGYLLMRITEVGEEYGIKVELVSEENTSTTCPLCKAKNQDHRRVYRGLLKCYKHSKVFNTDLVGAHNILLKTKTIPPSPTLHGVGVTRLVAPNPPEPPHFRAGRRSV
ncbi:MAG: zinc ribbon domain-containing protein, partial [Zestosphaera sp.]